MFFLQQAPMRQQKTRQVERKAKTGRTARGHRVDGYSGSLDSDELAWSI